jgi:hypothetical protein
VECPPPRKAVLSILQYHDDLRLRDGQLEQSTCAISAHILNVHDGAGIISPSAASGPQAAIPDFLVVLSSTKGVGHWDEDPVWGMIGMTWYVARARQMLDAAKRQLEPRANEASGNRQESGLQERQGLRDHSGLKRSSLSFIWDPGEIIRTLQANSNVNVTSDMCSWLPRRHSFRRVRHTSKRGSSREIKDCCAISNFYS